jgi:hypothetical protein
MDIKGNLKKIKSYLYQILKKRNGVIIIYNGKKEIIESKKD